MQAADRTGGRARKVVACKYIRIYITLRDFGVTNGRVVRALLYNCVFWTHIELLVPNYVLVDT